MTGTARRKIMNYLSLYAGIAGGDLGFKLAGHKCIGYVEWESFPQQILAQRQKDGFLDKAPIFSDVRAFIDSGCAELYRGITDIISAGVPCQAWSGAGKRRGTKDDRNLWPVTLECARIIKPSFIWFENVVGFIGCADSGSEGQDMDEHPTVNVRYFGTILSQLSEMGYNARWCVLGADDVGAYHRRKRVWILAHSVMHVDSRGRGSQE
jgi:DNA (cytosine-5)-methyltransferase 1